MKRNLLRIHRQRAAVGRRRRRGGVAGGRARTRRWRRAVAGEAVEVGEEVADFWRRRRRSGRAVGADEVAMRVYPKVLGSDFLLLAPRRGRASAPYEISRWEKFEIAVDAEVATSA